MTRLGGPVPHRNRPSTYLWSQLIQPLQATIDFDDPEVLARVGFAMSQLLGDFPAAFTALNRALRLHANSVLVLL